MKNLTTDQIAEQHGWNYIGDSSPEHGGLFWKCENPEWGYADGIEIDDAGNGLNTITRISINFDYDPIPLDEIREIEKQSA